MQELREEKPRTAKNQDKADMTNLAKILRCTTELLKRLEVASEKHRDAKVAESPGEENIVPEVLTKASAESKIFDKARPEDSMEPKTPVEEHIVTD